LEETAMPRLTTLALKKMKEAKEKIAVVTAYDYPFARLLDRAGADVLLVGDSLGGAVLGYENSTRVTMDDMLHHTKAVARGAESAMVVADMPFLSCDLGVEKAAENAGRLIQAGGAGAVKIEGGRDRLEAIRAVLRADVPVMGHLGLTPQSVLKLGGNFVQGRGEDAARRIAEDARALEQAGVFAVVLECIPKKLAAEITQALKIPTIGIGAGAGCDGQVLVMHDMLGLYQGKTPSFVKVYRDLAAEVEAGVKEYVIDVKTAKFPPEDFSY
jgi:3-methyl-2-oxobutanoate hydroxymethyltransferase